MSADFRTEHGPVFPPQPEPNRDYQVPPNALDGQQ